MKRIKVESGVPLPKELKPIPFTVALSEMDIGDSFYAEINPNKAARKIYAWRKSANRHAMKFTSRREKIGIRVWRLK